MTRPEKYVQDWLALLEYCKGEVDPVLFKQRHDMLATLYKQMDWAEQGEVAHILDIMRMLEIYQRETPEQWAKRWQAAKNSWKSGGRSQRST